MPKTIPSLQENKKPFHRRNGSGEIHVFESARYFESTSTTLPHKHYMREGGGRLSLDIPNTRRNSIPLQAMMMENRHSVPLQSMLMDQNSVMIKNDKKHKQPSSPGGKLAHFLNSLFNQTSSKKSKSKSTTSTHSVKDEDESPSGWRRRRRSSISLFRSGNSNSTINVSDTKSSYSRTLPQAPTKSSTYKDLKTHPDQKPACEITKIPINENHNKNENPMIKSGFPEQKISSGNGLLEKVRVCDVKHDDDHHKKHDPTVEIRELKSFILDDDDGDSDSSSDLFELTNCDLGYYSSGLPVFETTHMDSIKRGAPISS
ncbi:hypothetical protein L1987_12008 [Smallanthus sonchifolius]|uniref:Uncharacterized protein n=1 Tax=Smallanthus sonchifolius TaxID=185202 RepID=A0ACB9JD47_9ASTR|nr:hypothetical protein L1987_12008 [Smallanthus sonchifolius]